MSGLSRNRIPVATWLRASLDTAALTWTKLMAAVIFTALTLVLTGCIPIPAITIPCAECPFPV